MARGARSLLQTIASGCALGLPDAATTTGQVYVNEQNSTSMDHRLTALSCSCWHWCVCVCVHVEGSTFWVVGLEQDLLRDLPHTSEQSARVTDEK
jgi:hypothetical protein